MDEKALAGGEPAAIEDVAPHREEGFGKRRGLDRRHSFGDRQALRSGRGAVLGVAAALHQCRDLVARVPVAHAFAEGDDAARELQARNVGGARRHGIVAGALHGVGRLMPAARRGSRLRGRGAAPALGEHQTGVARRFHRDVMHLRGKGALLIDRRPRVLIHFAGIAGGTPALRSSGHPAG